MKHDVLASLRAEIDAIEKADAVPAIESDPMAHMSVEGLQEAPRESEGQPHPLATDADKALKKIVSLVNASDKSQRAIRERLSREGFAEPAIEEAVARAIDYGFIDDARFTEVLIRSRVSQGRGSAGIERELSENGIVAEEVPGWPYEYPFSYDEELDRALTLLERKPPRSKNAREAAYRRLMQKGYPSGVASSAARMWSER